ncbi:MAG: hypothetical protein HYZ81_08365 [Nitrospinae bacterium]|nr:hypothetical protein [Nitrospinota bacterium]
MLNIRKAIVFLALGVMLVGAVGVSVAAQRPTAQPRQPEITGRMGAPEMILRGPVVFVNQAGGFIVMRKGVGRQAEEVPIEVDAKTALTRAGQRVKIDTVKPGDMVMVHYAGRPGEVAKMVEVTPGKGMGGSKPAMKKMKPAAGKPAPVTR